MECWLCCSRFRGYPAGKTVQRDGMGWIGWNTTDKPGLAASSCRAPPTSSQWAETPSPGPRTVHQCGQGTSGTRLIRVSTRCTNACRRNTCLFPWTKTHPVTHGGEKRYPCVPPSCSSRTSTRSNTRALDGNKQGVAKDMLQYVH